MRWLAVLLFAAACSKAAKNPDAPSRPATPYEPRGPVEDPVGAKIAQGAMEIELVTDDGVILKGTLWDTKAPDPVIAIFVHQLSSDRYEWAPFIQSLRPPLDVDGVDRTPPARILSIDMRGHGKSTRTTDGRLLSWRDFSEADWKQLPLDVKAAVEYARRLEPKNNWIALAGSSIGSSAVILYAAQDPNIWRVALFSPRLSYHGLDIQEAYKTVLARTQKEAPFDPEIYVSEGDTLSAKAAEQLGGSVLLLEGSAHGVQILNDDKEGRVLQSMYDFVLALD